MSVALALALAAQDAPIVITGRGLDEPEGGQVVLIEEDKVDEEATGRLEGVLSEVAGLSFFRRADARSVHPTAQGPTARGLGGNAASRIAITLDGVPQADPFGGWINPAAFDPATLGRVIVARGARPEPGAIGGQIYLESPTAGPRSAALAYGSDDSWDASAVWGAEVGQGLFVASAGWMRSDGFVPIVAEDRGPADRGAASDQKVARLRLSYPVGRVETQVGLTAFDDERDRGVDGTDNRARGLDLSARLVGRDGAGWSLTGWWQDRDFETRFAAVDGDRETPRVVLDQYDVPATGAGARGEVGWRAGAVDGNLGGEWRRAEATVAERFFFVAGDPTRERRAGGETRLLGLFGGAEVEREAWSLAATIRADQWRFSDGFRAVDVLAGGSLEDSHFADRSSWQESGRIDAAFRPSERVTLRAAAARAVRSPTLNELVRPFRVGANATAANENLVPETSDQIELGVDWADEGSSVRATAFAARLDDGIFNVPVNMGPGLFPGVGFVSSGAILSERQNLPRVKSHGVEVDSVHALGPVDLRFSYAFADPKLAKGPFAGNRPPQVARHQLSAGVGWDDGEGRSAALRLTYASGRFEDLENDRPLGDAVSLDAALRWPLTDMLQLEARGTNLTNARALAGFASDGARERTAPRTLWIGLRVGRD
ncbi:TonB-dependent receptor [Sphingomicrobium clamense]|uniref:TonB-dependent receptor n=1 Tax=Sphingomicrobium clamense TaxID=2851013 RepID=A0ABS6V2B0_9SPHN|nr:TonB-dependent receptor [Sphingomicrobium sp. B8]MBW0143703.1 TonB-dependent receptor [Sphingomicrobium sp. B8]